MEKIDALVEKTVLSRRVADEGRAGLLHGGLFVQHSEIRRTVRYVARHQTSVFHSGRTEFTDVRDVESCSLQYERWWPSLDQEWTSLGKNRIPLPPNSVCTVSLRSRTDRRPDKSEAEVARSDRSIDSNRITSGNLGINRLVAKKSYARCFPLHEVNHRCFSSLYDLWEICHSPYVTMWRMYPTSYWTIER